jgi:hypothetical protein
MFAVPASVFAEQLYIGVAPNNSNNVSTASPGTLIRTEISTDDMGNTNVVSEIVGDAFPDETMSGYGGLAFDSAGTLWATVGKDDADGFGTEDGTFASTLVRIDTTNGSVVGDGVNVQDSNENRIGIIDLAYNTASNTLFGLNTSTSIDDQQPCDICIFTIDTSSGTATLVGQPKLSDGSVVELLSIAVGPYGTLYGTGVKAFTSVFNLYTLDPSTAAVLSTEAIVRDPLDPFQTMNTANSFGLTVRPSDGTIFGTLCCSNEIVYRDNGSTLWRFLDSTGISSDTYADLAFAPEAIPTPVPASVWLFGSGLAALLGLRRRRA